MAQAEDDEPLDSSIRRVSDSIVSKQGGQPVRNRLRWAKLWLFIDVSRWRLIAGLVVTLYITIILAGVLGPATVHQYLLDGTAISDTYIDLQAGTITVITIALAINQLVLSPEFGSVGKQQTRLEEILSHRADVEVNADIISSPTAPSRFLRSITDATREHIISLRRATSDTAEDDASGDILHRVQDMEEELNPVSHALEDQRFSQIELYGVAIHFNTNQHIHQVRRIRRLYDQELTDAQLNALDTLLTALKQFEVAREYFRTRYLQTQFIRFSNGILLTGLPSLAVAHYSAGLIGPDVLTGSTFGIQHLLWFEAGAFAIALVPVLVILSFVARIIVLAKTSIFIGPFSAPDSLE